MNFGNENKTKKRIAKERWKDRPGEKRGSDSIRVSGGGYFDRRTLIITHKTSKARPEKSTLRFVCKRGRP